VNRTNATGYAIVFGDDSSPRSNFAVLIFAEDAPIGPNMMNMMNMTGPPPGVQLAGIQIAEANISDIWQANVPVSFRATRQGLNVSVYINDSPVPVMLAPFNSARPPNVDASLQAPLLVSPRFIPGFSITENDMDAFVAEMSIASSASVL